MPTLITKETMRDARKVAKSFGVNSLLAAPESNPKVAKNGKLGVMTAPLHLAPAKLSGYEVCPMRTAGCTAACLHTAGNPAYMKGKEKARIARTKMYFEARANFMVLLIADIEKLVTKAEKAGMEPAVRLNATSDIPWERIRYEGKSLMEHFPNVQFYDYTKVTKRAIAAAESADWPSNYHLTSSAAEDNDVACAAVLGVGGTVAMVFHKVPKAWKGFEVIDGDETDYRPLDPAGVIVGLKAKGYAKRDTSGFVR